MVDRLEPCREPPASLLSFVNRYFTLKRRITNPEPVDNHTLLSKPLSRARPIGYMHIPKTGGTTFTNQMLNSLGQSRSRVVLDEHFFPDEVNLYEIAPNKLACISPFGPLSGDERIVSGHISLSTFLAALPNVQLVTILREPVCRLLSNWVYLRTFAEDNFRGWSDEWERRSRLLLGSFKTFLADPRNFPLVDNLALRMLLRPHRLITAGPIEEQHDELLFAEALGRLREFHFVDFLENPQLNINFAKWIGDAPIQVVLNKTGKVAEHLKVRLEAELTPEVFELLKSRTRLDLRLWEFVVQTRLAQSGPGSIRFRTIRRTVRNYTALM